VDEDPICVPRNCRRSSAVQKVLATGGAGFIGSCLVDKLTVGNRHVTVLDNFDRFYDSVFEEL